MKRLALAAAGALCAAALAGCGSSSTPLGFGTSDPSAANGPGQWTSAQISDATLALNTPPINEDAHQAACLVKVASANLSWQEFVSFVRFLRESAPSGAPLSTTILGNAASQCSSSSGS